jgi:hypothetical protein
MHIIVYTLLTVGILFLVGLTGLSTVAAAKDRAPILQPSLRPTAALPTLEPTLTIVAPTSTPPQTSTQVPTPTPTPTSSLLPDSGGAFHRWWPLGLGICLTLFGLVCLFIRQQHA